MTAREGRRLANLSRPSLVLAVGSSAAVAAAAVAGHNPGATEAAGGFAVAGAIAVLNTRGRSFARPHVLTSLPERFAGPVVIDAARARSMAAHPAGRGPFTGQSDAA
jgi:hypothetical protein